MKYIILKFSTLNNKQSKRFSYIENIIIDNKIINLL